MYQLIDETVMPWTIEYAAMNTFKSNFKGAILLPGDIGYDEARLVWNGMIDRRPALIARCADAQDVIAAVNFARETGLRVAVRGGGHNVAGHATVDNGILIDLSLMNSVEVDPAARTARAGGGARWGDVDRATQVYGLATPGGVVSDTGIAGLTLGGGFGWLRNKFGLSCDNVIGADVVTADGRLLRASAEENPDLFWAIRGGGGNFGIVTAFEYQLYPVGPEVMFCFVFHPGDRPAEGLRFFRDFAASAPDEVSALAFLGQFPPLAHFPAELHGQPFLAFGALYAGPAEEGIEILRPLREFSAPVLDMSGVMPYAQAQTVFDEDYPAHEMRYYWKSLNLMSLDDAAIEKIVAHGLRQPSPFSTTDIWPIGGAVKRFGPDDNAFHGRHAGFLVNPEANWIAPEDDAANLTWVRDFVAALEPWSDGSRYLNFAGFQEEGDAMMQAAFGAQYERLAQVKRQYDPTNLFSLNQNIKPAL